MLANKVCPCHRQLKMHLQANFFIGDIKFRHDFYRTCTKIFCFGQIVRVLWPFKVGKSALSDEPCPVTSLFCDVIKGTRKNRLLMQIHFILTLSHLHCVRFRRIKNGE